MRLRILGFICPCGDTAWRQTGDHETYAWWDGYAHRCFCAYGCQSEYFMLFTRTRRFVCIVSDNGDDQMSAAGGVRFWPDEIPF